MSSFLLHNVKIRSFIDNIESGKTRLPCFQRDFKWNPAKIKSLMNSIQHEYPAGTLLYLSVDRDNPLIPFQGFRYTNESSFTEKPEALVLDGQQRMTSCYAVFTNKGYYTYYINFIKLMELYNSGIEDIDLETVIVHKRHNSTPMSELSNGLFPMAYLRDRKIKREQLKIFINDIKDDPEKADICDFLLYSFDEILDPILDYEFPVVELPSSSSMEAVCKVFQTINTTGLKLSVFDICVAVFMPKGVNLKDMVLNSSLTHSYAKYILDKDPTSVLQVVALLANKAPNTNTLASLLEARDISDYWEDAINGIEDALIMFDEFGAGTKKNLSLLPYTPMIPIVAAVLSRTKYTQMSVPSKSKTRSKIKTYFYTAALSNRYTEGTNAKINDDFKALNLWISNDQVPGMILHGVDWNSQKIVDYNKNGAFGKAILCLLNSANPKDFYLDKQVGIGEGIESCDLHHLFPKAKYELSYKELINSVFNFTWLTKESNIFIQDDRTCDYIQKIISETGKSKNDIKNLLATHQIDEQLFDYMYEEKYIEFIRGRADSCKKRLLNYNIAFQDVGQDDLDIDEEENEETDS